MFGMVKSRNFRLVQVRRGKDMLGQFMPGLFRLGHFRRG
jgi:hypothetical protein